MTSATTYQQSNSPASSLRWLGRSLTSAPDFQLHTVNSLERDKVETYIRDQFRLIYNAKISNFMPYLITMNCEDGISATAGMRPADQQPLFLEQYLPQTVEQRIATLTNAPTSRRHIVEIGNLAATRRGSSQLLFLILTGLLDRTQFEWIVFTGNHLIAKSLQRLGIELHNLGDADPDQLSLDKKSDWGSYYQSNPHVFSANIAQGKRAMDSSRMFGAIFDVYAETINSLALTINSRVRSHA